MSESIERLLCLIAHNWDDLWDTPYWGLERKCRRCGKVQILIPGSGGFGFFLTPDQWVTLRGPNERKH